MANERQIRFAYEYAKDLNATQAAIRAGYSEKTAGSQGHDLLKIPEIREIIEDRKEQLATVAKLDKTFVLRQWLDIATADNNELSRVTRTCCRYCWGLSHEYQWSEREYREALDKALNAEKPKPAPDGMGGFGWNPLADPCPECPECHGEGVEQVYVADTRKLKGAARRLYAGVKRTRDGLEIKTRDQDAALANIARYLGMSLDRTEISGPGGGPLPLATITAGDLSDDDLASLIAGSKNNF